MKKVVILGSMGMAGHVMMMQLQTSGYEVLGVARNEGRFVHQIMDVTDFAALKYYLECVQPDYVVNCVGALVSHADENVMSAIMLNSYLPHFLAESGKQVGYKLVHISTDCVFSGEKGNYSEASFRDGDNHYARTKALGEVVNNRDLTIRTSIIGPELKMNGTGLFDFFLKQEGQVQGYMKAIWSGVTTLELAKATVVLLQGEVCGLYHLTNGEPISKYELLKLFKKHTGKSIAIEAVDGHTVDKSLVDTRQELAYTLPSYDSMVSDMVGMMKQHADLYPHYSPEFLS